METHRVCLELKLRGAIIKKIIVGMFLILTMSNAWAIDNIGRYQIIPVKRTNDFGSTEEIIIKIDTITGKSWEYELGSINEGKTGLYGWHEIPNEVRYTDRKPKTVTKNQEDAIK